MTATAPTNRITDSNGHIVPYLESDEADLLTCIIYKPSVLPDALKIVSPRHFSYPPNAIIFRHMVDIQSRGLSADPVLLLRQIDEAGDFENLDGGTAGGGTIDGGRAYLHEIANRATGVDNSLFYAEKIREKFEQRRLVETCHLAINRLGDGESVSDVRQFIADDLKTCGGTGPVLAYFSDIESRDIDWLWEGRIARGKLTILVGDPGIGKSVATVDFAARVSAGYAWPDLRDKPTTAGSVIMLSAEDDPHDTIRPRLDAAGADVSRVAVLASSVLDGNDRPKSGPDFVSLQNDLNLLESAIVEAQDCRLLIVDPLSSYLGKADSHRDAEMRTVLKPLSDLAMRHNVAILAVTHLNKNQGSSAMYRATGSLAFVAAARSVWLVARDKDDKARRLMLPIKNNIGPDTGGLAFTVVPSEGNSKVPVISWYADAVTTTADEALEPAKKQGAKVTTAGEWLTKMLADGPVLVSEIKAQAEVDEFSWRTIERAKSALDIESIKDGYQSPAKWKIAADGGGF